MTIPKIESQWEFAGSPKPVLRDNLEALGGEGGGREAPEGRERVHTYGWFMLTWGQSHRSTVVILQLKIKFKK